MILLCRFGGGNMRILIKNANILSFSKEKFEKKDVLVDGNEIVKISNNIDTSCGRVIDATGNILMPAFANLYFNAERAIKNSYGKINADEFFKNSALAGVCFGKELDSSYLENIASFSEKQLDEICLNLKSPVYVKIGQNLEEMGEINALSKKMPSEYLEDFGILDKKTFIIGGNCFEKDEIELFSNYNVSFILLPSDDARSGRRFANINTLKKYEISFGLGSGEFAEINFFEMMRQILSYNSFVMENSSLMTAKEILEIATIKGAEMLGENGEVKEKNKANFLIVKRDERYINPFNEIVFGKNNNDILFTIKNGKILQENGVFVMEN